MAYSKTPSTAKGSRYCTQACQWPTRYAGRAAACKGCGGSFVPTAKRKSLCTGCRGKRGARVEKVCEWCGASFRVKPYLAEGARHCDAACRAAHRALDVAFKCEECGATSAKKPHLLRKGFRFCSRKCSGSWHGKNTKGEKSPRWRGGARVVGRNAGIRRRAREKGAAVEKVSREDVVMKYGRECYICGRALCDKQLTIDHVIPLSKGGAHTLHNLRPACRSCNSRKHYKLLEEFICFLS